MPVSVACLHCKRTMKAPESMLGKKVRCPGCGNIFVVSADSPIPVLAVVPAPAVVAPPAVASASPPEPAAPAPSPREGQKALRIIVLCFGFLGALGAGFMGFQLYDKLMDTMQSIPLEKLQFGLAFGGQEKLREYNALPVLPCLMFGSALLGVVGGALILHGRGFLPAFLLLLGLGLPAIFEPKMCLFTSPLVIAGLLALLVSATPGVKRSAGKLVLDVLAGTIGVAILAFALIEKFKPDDFTISHQIGLAKLVGLPDPAATSRPPTTPTATSEPFTIVGRSIGSTIGNREPSGRPSFSGDDDISSGPARGNEVLRGNGFASPDEAIDQMVRATLALDVDAYKKWLENVADGTVRFERSLQAEMEYSKTKPKEFAAKQIIENTRDQWMKNRTQRTAIIPDGEEYASIIFVSKGLEGWRAEATYKKFAFKKSKDRWFPIGDRVGELTRLKPPLPQGTAMRDVVPADAPLPVLDYTDVLKDLKEMDQRPPKDADEARTVLKKKFEKLELDADGTLLSLGSDFSLILDLRTYKALVMLLTPKFKDKKVNLLAPYFTDADMEKFAALTAFEELFITGPTHITDKGLASLKGLTNLKKLDLECPYATDAGLVHLKGLTKLEELKLHGRFTDAGLAHLAGLTSLKELDLKANYITGPGLANLKGLTELHALELIGNNITARGLEQLPTLPALGRLYLAQNGLDDAALEPIAKAAPALESLDLAGNQITDRGLAAMAKMPKLHWVSLAYNRITGPGLVHIAKIGTGEGQIFRGTLDLKHNPLTDEAIPHLGAVSQTGMVKIELDDAMTNKLQESLKATEHLGSISSIAFSPDGKSIASASMDRTVKLWDVATVKPRDTFHGGGAYFFCVVFTPDGKQVISGDYDHVIRVWDLGGNKEKAQSLYGQRTLVYSVSIAADGKTLVTAGGGFGEKKGAVVIWNLPDDKPRLTIEVPAHVTHAVITPDGKTIASGDTEKLIRLWDVASGKQIAELKGHNDSVSDLAVSSDGKTLASASKDKTIKVWELPSGKERMTLQGHEGEIRTVAISSDGKMLASGGNDKTVRLWDVASGKEIAVITDYPGEVSSVKFSPDGKLLAAGGAAKSIKVWEVAAALKAFPVGERKADPLAALTRLKAKIEYERNTPVEVRLYDDNIFDNDLVHLKGLTELRKLSISSKKVTDAGLAHLAGLTEMEELTLGSIFGTGPQITDAGLVHLKGMTNLQKLTLSGSRVTGTGLEHLKGAVGLQWLWLMESPISDAGLAPIKNFRNLEDLNLYKTPLTGTGMVHLKGLTRLRGINLNDAKNFTDAGLEALEDVPSLEYLALKHTQITDAGLMHLKPLTKLNSLDIEDSKATDDGLRKLRAAQAAGNPAQYIKGLGGSVTVDEDSPDKPVIKVRLGDKFTEADLTHLKKFPKLRELHLFGAKLTDASLIQLQGLPQLEELSFSFVPITGAGLSHLKGLTKLRDLSLSYTEITDAGIASLNAFPQLQLLNFTSTKITDAGLANLAGLTKLEHLSLNDTPITDAGLAHLKGMVNLGFLDISNTKVIGAGLVHLKGAARLKTIRGYGTTFNDAGMAGFKDLVNLEELTLTECKITDAGLAHLQGLTKLKNLNLSEIPVTDSGLVNLKALTNLEILYLKKTKITDAGLANLKGMSKLWLLNLEDTAVTDNGLLQMAGLSRLDSIDSKNTKITEAGIKAFGEAREAAGPGGPLKKLGGRVRYDEASPDRPIVRVEFSGSSVTDAGLAILKNFPKLQNVVLDGTKISDAGLAHLQGLKELKMLVLVDTKITDAGLAFLKGLTKLEHLDLEGTQVTDAGLAYLKGLVNLDMLDLNGTKVTDAGLTHLKGLSKLRSLGLAETKVTDNGVKMLQAALPQLKIVR